MAPSTGGSRIGDRNAPSSPSWMTPQAGSCMRASWRQSRPSTTSGPREPIWSAMASRWRSIPTRHAIFRVNSKEAQGGDGMTQFGRALDELTIEIICANAPQSKGRVERRFGTRQDRLVKDLRLAGIDTAEVGNAFLPGFLEAHNARFAKTPFSERNAHRPLTERDNLDEVFAWREERTVTQSLTLQDDQMLFLLEPNEVTRPLARQRVMVCDYPDGRLAIKHKGRELPYRVFDKRQRVNQAAIVENKRLGPVLAYIAERQKELDMSRSKRAPSRRGQAAGLFKVG